MAGLASPSANNLITPCAFTGIRGTSPSYSVGFVSLPLGPGGVLSWISLRREICE